ncbi:subunit 4 of CCR4-NOT transcription complex [Hamiltosporidium tvaerminnensis]|uniref:Subunit 4 of CCR4-NOT transcription complex n=2 Tax=Hamiltosporidium TaxID=1176354 RepID=A0A4Q9LK89_9MICR|nr:CCR4-NOT transcription complex subunit 4 [Hamiltosporidium tvaerminnensis]TBU00639.1 subunit 4 of CCR4-NOT transcription complex [Hamiltosporidium tvaerminnensis]TBU08663.1 subunit 4 of CCR4-NOT transcription complex [Hamiltosporidium magnivora]
MIDRLNIGETVTYENATDLSDKKNYCNIRVIQKNLVYVIGIPQKYADDNLLKRNEFFGQFGSIKKLVVNKRTSSLDTTASAYITYSEESEASKCITEVDESLLDNRIIKCTYGTTKYCSFYLKNVVCQNSECMYLHEPGSVCDSLTKDEMCNSKHKLHSFESKNKNKEVIGKKTDIDISLHSLFKYKEKRNYRIPEKINFEPNDF